MTQALRDAAQALLKSHDAWATIGEIKARWDALRAALSAPQTTADELVSRLVDQVISYGDACMSEQRAQYRGGHESQAGYPRYDLHALVAGIEQSARALLSASQEDAEHAAMYRWLRINREAQMPDGTVVDVYDEHGSLLDGGELDAAIRSAMKEKKA